MKEWLTVITSSPGCTPAINKARCNAVVQLDTAQAYGAPTYAAKRRSNSATFGPCVIHPDKMTSRTAAASSSPMDGLVMGLMHASFALEPIRAGATRLIDGH